MNILSIFVEYYYKYNLFIIAWKIKIYLDYKDNGNGNGKTMNFNFDDE